MSVRSSQAASPPVDICMVVRNPMTNDSRVHREASTLAVQGWRVVVVGVALGYPSLPEIEEVREGYTIVRDMPRVFRNRKGRHIKRVQWLITLLTTPRLLRRINARVYHGHEFIGLLYLALAGIWRRPVVYDVHELFFDSALPSKGFRAKDRFMRLFRPLERYLAHRAAGVIVVSEPIADWLARKLNIPRPVVLQNMVKIGDIEPSSVVYPTQGRRTIVHTGGLSKARHLPELVSALAYMPDDIVLVLMGAGPLRDQLLALAIELDVFERLIIIPPVPINKVVSTMAQANIAAVLVSSQTAQYDLTMANKFYEAVAAGLPLVCSPTTAAAAVMRQFDLGVLCDPTDPKAIAEAVCKLLEPETYAYFRAKVLKAREVLNWETEERKLIDLYQNILSASG